MSGFIGNDGSELVGGLNPSGVVQAFKTNALGDLKTTGGNKELAGLSASANNALLVPLTDVSGYQFLSFHVSGTFSATYQFQISNDGVNFITYQLHRPDTESSANDNVQSNISNMIWMAPIVARYFQVQIVAYVSGTVNAVLELSTQAPGYVPASVQIATNFNQIGTVGLVAGTSVIGSIANDGTATTAVAAATVADTVIKNSAGLLARILVTAVGTANVLIWDNASGHTGTVIGVIKSTAAVGDIIELHMPAANGITVQGNTNNGGFTVSWV